MIVFETRSLQESHETVRNSQSGVPGTARGASVQIQWCTRVQVAPSVLPLSPWAAIGYPEDFPIIIEEFQVLIQKECPLEGGGFTDVPTCPLAKGIPVT